MAKELAESRQELPSPENYNAFVGSADLVDVKLIKSAFSVSPEFFGMDDEDQDLRHSCELSAQNMSGETKLLMGFYACDATSKSGRKRVLNIKCTYLVVYEIEGDPPEDAAREFLSRVGRFACFPYFRSHVAQVCAEAGIKLPPLPILKGNLPRRIQAAAIEQKMIAE